MTRFQCIPIDTAIADRFRRTGLDDNGNTLRRVVATPEGGCPCRHCLRYAENEVAPIVRANALVSVRAYDNADQCIYDLGQVCSGEDVDAPLARALGDARTAFVNIHTARPGCLLARVERTG
jgi:hypothetical protein